MDSTGAHGGGGRAGEAGGPSTWTAEVDDLLDAGDLNGAISLLESVIFRLETLRGPSSSAISTSSASSGSDLRLASALDDLANLHSIRGCPLQADELRARSILIRAEDSRPHHNHHLGSRDSFVVALKDKGQEEKQALQFHVSRDGEKGNEVASKEKGQEEKQADQFHVSREDEEKSEVDDWEAIADDALPDLGISRITKEHTSVSSGNLGKAVDIGTPKRRGRGSFLYRKNGLYSDEVDVGNDSGDYDSQKDLGWGGTREEDNEKRGSRSFGTRHILVLYDLPPSTQTVDLEKLLERFGDSGVAIRWIDGTSALAVFRTPTAAQEAQNSVKFPFKVRAIDGDDSILDQISPSELEPPHPRPKTSARTAHRMITQVMGFKPSTDFGSSELKKQEQARKHRIQSRHSMRDEAWGGSDGQPS